jgi:hypothetical protein
VGLNILDVFPSPREATILANAVGHNCAWKNVGLILFTFMLQMGERRDKALKELMDQVATKQPNSMCHGNKENFWEGQGFKFIVSMSMLALVILAKR